MLGGDKGKNLVIGWEWIVIIAIVAIILIWGPGQIPKLAKSLGQAKREIEQASKEEDKEAVKKEEAKVEVDPLIVTAIKMGIDVTGKTKEQISQEIIARSKTQRS
jgi:sec-independent protein translocase protein TatA